MNCAYPLCGGPQEWIPVIKFPVVRTAGMSDDLVSESKPALLIGEPICDNHMISYDFYYWFERGAWEDVRKEAAHRGFIMAPLPKITFERIGWKPDSRYLEMDR
jgi:hypothetical protein